jgi:hypothetical protein
MEVMFSSGMTSAVMNSLGGRALLSKQMGGRVVRCHGGERVCWRIHGRPWHPRMGHGDRRALLPRVQVALVRLRLDEDPGLRPGALTTEESPRGEAVWEETHPREAWPGCHIRTAHRVKRHTG